MLSWGRILKQRGGIAMRQPVPLQTEKIQQSLVAIAIADEGRALAWWSAAFAAVMTSAGFVMVMASQTASQLPPEMPLGLHEMQWRALFALSLALVAAGYAIFLSEQRQPASIKGLLGAWWLAFALPLIYSGPLYLKEAGTSQLTSQLSGLSAALVALILSLVYQGARSVFFAGLSFLVLVAGVDAFFGTDDFRLKTTASLLALALGVFFLRESRTRELRTLGRLEETHDRALAVRAKIGELVDSSDAARERLLGPLTGGLSFSSVQGPALTIEALVNEARCCLRSLQKLQSPQNVEQHLEPNLEPNLEPIFAQGPVRFVFFPPGPGTAPSTLIAGEIATLTSGIETCLRLALASLPEIGSRQERREGVVRLSIRVGQRVAEIAVEDNGRGTWAVVGAPSLAEKLNGFRRYVESHGGRLERFARLGVGARIIIELPIRVGFSLHDELMLQAVSAYSPVSSEFAEEV